MIGLSKVVSTLRNEHSRLEKEMERIEKALHVLGRSNGNHLRKVKRVLSKEARRRIAEAQRKRWAKVRKAAA